MRLNGELAVVQARVGELGLRVVANEAWLASGFLADERITPRRYLVRAEEHKALRQRMFALTERLLSDAPLRPVA